MRACSRVGTPVSALLDVVARGALRRGAGRECARCDTASRSSGGGIMLRLRVLSVLPALIPIAASGVGLAAGCSAEGKRFAFDGMLSSPHAGETGGVEGAGGAGGAGSQPDEP